MRIRLNLLGDDNYFGLWDPNKVYAFIHIFRYSTLKVEIEERLKLLDPDRNFRKRFLERMYERWCR